MPPAQIITDKNGAPASDMSDEELYDIAKAEAGEFFPVDLAKRLVVGAPPDQGVPGIPGHDASRSGGPGRYLTHVSFPD